MNFIFGNLLVFYTTTTGGKTVFFLNQHRKEAENFGGIFPVYKSFQYSAKNCPIFRLWRLLGITHRGPTSLKIWYLENFYFETQKYFTQGVCLLCSYWKSILVLECFMVDGSFSRKSRKKCGNGISSFLETMLQRQNLWGNARISRRPELLSNLKCLPFLQGLFCLTFKWQPWSGMGAKCIAANVCQPCERLRWDLKKRQKTPRIFPSCRYWCALQEVLSRRALKCNMRDRMPKIPRPSTKTFSWKRPLFGEEKRSSLLQSVS